MSKKEFKKAQEKVSGFPKVKLKNLFKHADTDSASKDVVAETQN